MSIQDIPRYEIGQQVWLTFTEDLKGFIAAILLDTDGIQYRVVYWADGIRRSEWCYPNEIRGSI